MSNQLPGRLAANRHLWKAPQDRPQQTSCLSADSASSAGAYLTASAAAFDGWSVRDSKWTDPLERQAAALPGWAWSAVEPIRWRDENSRSPSKPTRQSRRRGAAHGSSVSPEHWEHTPSTRRDDSPALDDKGSAPESPLNPKTAVGCPAISGRHPLG